MNKKTRYAQGFTIVELIMATAVFSLVLLLGLTGFIQVGRMFYKGVTISQTKDVVTTTVQTISGDIKLAKAVQVLNGGTTSPTVCIGNHRYSVRLNTAVDTSASNGNYALKREIMPSDICDTNPISIAQAASPELLGNRMRLLKFDVREIGSGTDLYFVNIKIAYGADEDFENPNTAGAQCKNSVVSSQFCATTEFSTYVYKGVSI